MRITYDPKADVMSIKFQKGKYFISDEVAEGIIIDRIRSDKVISIEILDVSKRLPKKK
ncbi:MAG: DUF2283 domain-containing protein [Candidatus Aenigmarchaeota archaeon]|nr:DUF2283 domain-containing protein [Candidatus Aenigmarchaeota archaeon]